MKIKTATKVIAMALAGIMVCGTMLPVSAKGQDVVYADILEDQADEGIASASAKLPSTVKLNAASLVYTGKAQLPSITVKDGNKTVDKKYYTIAAAKGDNAKTVGSHKVTIKFESPYSGSKTFTYSIVPRGTSINSFTSDNNSITVKYNKQATQTAGYQIMYGTSANLNDGKTVKVSGINITSKRITGLSYGTNYYFKIRTYKKTNGKTYYSSWSSVKGYKTAGKSSDDELLNLPYDYISKRVTIGGKEFSKNTRQEIRDYLKNYPGARLVDDDFMNSDFYGVGVYLGSNYLGIFNDELKNAYLQYGYARALFWQDEEVFGFSFYFQESPDNGLHKKMPVKTFAQNGKNIYDLLKPGLYKQILVEKADTVIPIKGGVIVSNVTRDSDGGIEIKYDNGYRSKISNLRVSLYIPVK